IRHSPAPDLRQDPPQVLAEIAPDVLLAPAPLDEGFSDAPQVAMRRTTVQVTRGDVFAEQAVEAVDAFPAARRLSQKCDAGEIAAAGEIGAEGDVLGPRDLDDVLQVADVVGDVRSAALVAVPAHGAIDARADHAAAVGHRADQVVRLVALQVGDR